MVVDETSWPFWAAPPYGLWRWGGRRSGDREGGSTGALTASPPTPAPLLLKPQVFETELGIYGE